MTVGTGKGKKNHCRQIRLGKEAATFKDQGGLWSKGQEVDGTEDRKWTGRKGHGAEAF